MLHAGPHADHSRTTHGRARPLADGHGAALRPAGQRDRLPRRVGFARPRHPHALGARARRSPPPVAQHRDGCVSAPARRGLARGAAGRGADARRELARRARPQPSRAIRADPHGPGAAPRRVQHGLAAARAHRQDRARGHGFLPGRLSRLWQRLRCARRQGPRPRGHRTPALARGRCEARGGGHHSRFPAGHLARRDDARERAEASGAGVSDVPGGVRRGPRGGLAAPRAADGSRGA